MGPLRALLAPTLVTVCTVRFWVVLDPPVCLGRYAGVPGLYTLDASSPPNSVVVTPNISSAPVQIRALPLFF